MLRNIILIFFALFALTSCEKDIKVKTPEYTPLLVISSFTPGNEVIMADVTKSTAILGYNGQQPLNVPDATVKLYTNGNYTETMKFDVDVLSYTSVTMPAPGNIYKIVASAPGFSEAEGMSDVPEIIPITQMKHTVAVRNHSNGYLQDEITITFKDPAKMGDYYLVELLHGMTFDTMAFGGGYPFVGCVNSSDPSIESTSSFDFGDDDCIGTDNLYLSDELFNGNTKEFKFYIESNWLMPYQDSAGRTFAPRIRFHHISAAYFKYLKTLRNASDNEGNPFSEPVNVYTNIKNGYGIFSIGTYAEKEIK